MDVRHRVRPASPIQPLEDDSHADADVSGDIVERDASGHVLGAYTYSKLDKRVMKTTRRSATRVSAQTVVQMFLPSGYPETVTPDYLRYQMFDSLQAFSSEIAGLMASRAVLKVFGVGDAKATPTEAVLLSTLQETFGRLATILSAWKLGPALEAEAKKYRLAADLFNDVGIILECLSPALPRPLKVGVLCVSRVSRSLCGVTAGGAKAALSRHFVAPGGSIADVNAKETSQETVVALMGMLVGSLLMPHITTPQSTWTALLILIGVHLYTNYLGVRAVVMPTLSRQRASIVCAELISRGRVLTPREVALKERIFERDGVLRWSDGRVLGHCVIGAPFEALLAMVTPLGHGQSGRTVLGDVTRLFAGEAYILWCSIPRRGTSWGLWPAPRPQICICLKKNAKAADMLRAWLHALMLARHLAELEVRSRAPMPTRRELAAEEVLDAVKETLGRSKELFGTGVDQLRAAGWDIEGSALITAEERRLDIVDEVLVEKKSIVDM